MGGGDVKHGTFMQPWLDHSGRFSTLKATIFALLFLPGIWIGWAGPPRP